LGGNSYQQQSDSYEQSPYLRGSSNNCGEDSLPTFIIKPFEKSIEQIEADGQIPIQAFTED